MATKKTPTKRYATQGGGRKAKRSKRKLRRALLTILLILLLGAVAVFLMLRGDGRVSIFENALGSVFTPVQSFFHSITNGARSFFTNWRNYNTLQSNYDALEFENEQLRMQLVATEEAVAENERLQTLLDARPVYEALDPIYAKVIARDAGPWFLTFSINRGTSHGISTGMAVVNGDGLVGLVTDVGLNYAKVRSIIDPRSGVACLVQRTRDNGVMHGQAADSDGSVTCRVKYLPNVNSIIPGDVIVTSGTDSIYPKGLKIGTVSVVSLDGGYEGAYALITPSVDFRRIEEVFVLRTVIETDSEENKLPQMITPSVTRQPSVTAAPKVSASPEPSEGPNYWSRPTVAPTGAVGTSTQEMLKPPIEDEWASMT